MAVPPHKSSRLADSESVELPDRPGIQRWEPKDHKEVVKAASHEWTPVQRAALTLYLKGYERKEVARKLLKHLTEGSSHTDRARLLQMARGKLATWEKKGWFRDALWDAAVAKADLELPKVMGGVTAQAKKGDVAAAKLVLAVTGRHTDKEEKQPTSVTVVFGGLPRPQVLEGHVVEEEED